jgi:hypothetical protein
MGRGEGAAADEQDQGSAELTSSVRYGPAKPLPWLAPFAPLSLPFSMLHQTIVVLLERVSSDWTDAPLLEAVAIAPATLVVSLAGAVPVVGAGPVRALSGVPPHRPAARWPSARAA